jgi:Ca-activated chloride channel family protein
MFFMALLLTACLSDTSFAQENSLEITSRLSHPYMELNKEQTVFFKIGLKGKAIKPIAERASINIALVLDKSGSMQGQKMDDVKRASKMLIDRLGPRDVLSVIVYDNSAKVLVPATQLTNPESIKLRIDNIYADGGTALYDGVTLGSRELRRFISDNKVNRVLLLSDGMANVGPSEPHELAQLGRTLAQEGVSVSTIGLGLGYNEDLMDQLAASSDGFHQFAQETHDLGKAFDWQFGKLASIVANNTKVTLNFPRYVQPIRIIGRDGQVKDNSVQVELNQVFSSHEVYVLVEAKVMFFYDENDILPLADVNVTYHDLNQQTYINHTDKIVANLTRDPKVVSSSRDVDVIIAATEQTAAVEHAEIIKLRDLGQTKEAETRLEMLSSQVNQASVELNSGKLSRYGEILKRQLEDVKNGLDWNKTRKQGTATLRAVSFNTI